MYRLPLVFLLAFTALWFPDIQLDQILQGGSAAPVRAGCNLKVVSWNIERGLQFEAVKAALQKMKPEVVLLQEVDLNAQRTGRLNIAGQLADSLGMNYYFAREFEELGQGSRKDPAYHGQAVLTALPVYSTRIIRFKNQTGFWKPRWFIPNWGMFQRRTGGRIAFVTELQAGSRKVVIYNVHLESRNSERLRLSQIEQVIEDAARYPADTPILIAGDLNTRQENPPAVEALLRSNFRRAVGREITTSEGKALDWMFVRGPLNFTQGKVHREIRASDHFPLSVNLETGVSGCAETGSGAGQVQ
ncbi:MAG: hypothetical protein GXX84_01805 [Acidobacteria bacterium]|nr:hypothetical protein [Acidobacteriota bacterium]